MYRPTASSPMPSCTTAGRNFCWGMHAMSQSLQAACTLQDTLQLQFQRLQHISKQLKRWTKCTCHFREDRLPCRPTPCAVSPTSEQLASWSDLCRRWCRIEEQNWRQLHLERWLSATSSVSWTPVLQVRPYYTCWADLIRDAVFEIAIIARSKKRQ